MVVLTLFVNKTKAGKAMRAVSEDNGAAQLMGINVNQSISLTFAIGSGLAAVAGVLMCSAYPVLMPTTGAMPGIKAFTAAVFGGIGSIPGAMIGGLILGIIEIFSRAYISTELSDAIVFACLIIVLYFQARLAGFSPGSSLIPGFSNGSSKPAAETSEPVEESQESDNTDPVPAPDTNSSESPEKSTDTPVPAEDSPNDDADNSANQNNEDTAPEEESDQSEEDVEYTEEEPEYTEEDSEEEYYEDEGDHEEEEYYEDEDNYEDEGNQEYYEEEFDLREG
jgi:hypothetical protein